MAVRVLFPNELLFYMRNKFSHRNRKDLISIIYDFYSYDKIAGAKDTLIISY